MFTSAILKSASLLHNIQDIYVECICRRHRRSKQDIASAWLTLSQKNFDTNIEFTVGEEDGLYHNITLRKEVQVLKVHHTFTNKGICFPAAKLNTGNT